MPLPGGEDHELKPFMLGVTTFAGEGGKTRYMATMRHWTAAGREQREAVGFNPGRRIVTDQPEPLAKAL